MTKKLEVKIKFTEKELDLLVMLVGVALMEKDVSNSFDFSVEEKLSLNNKLRYLKICSKQKVREQKKSVCCDAPLIGGAQCESCGADGRKVEKK